MKLRSHLNTLAVAFLLSGCIASGNSGSSKNVYTTKVKLKEEEKSICEGICNCDTKVNYTLESPCSSGPYPYQKCELYVPPNNTKG